jgi:hypothetical protein
MVLIFSYIRKAYVNKIIDPSITNRNMINEVYYSDYFSFQGEDEQGAVLLAIDNNRWKDSKGYGLDHFLCMYAHDHWVRMAGNNKKFPNPLKKLITIPDDEILTFRGSPKSGLTISSNINRFVLQIAPLQLATKSKNGFARFNMLSAPAILSWRGEKIKGRVIEEYLVLPFFSRKPFQWVKLSAGTTFTGLYLSIEGKGVLYLHHKTGKGMSFIGGMNSGFIQFDNWNRSLDQFKMHITSEKRKLFYNLPMSYDISLTARNPSMKLTLETISRKDFASFVLAGFSMAAVEGSLVIDGKSYKAWGLAELIE